MELDFAQLHAERSSEAAGHTALYPVEVNFDLQELDAARGLTMVFDKATHGMRLELGLLKLEGLAWGRFEDHIDTTGWSELYMEATARPGVSNDVKVFAAGYIEGVLTCVRISQYYHNLREMLQRRPDLLEQLPMVASLFKKQLSYMKQQTNVQAHVMVEEPESAYWKQVRFVLFQTWGVCDGFNFAAKVFKVHRLAMEDFLLINAAGELTSILQVYTPLAVSQRTEYGRSRAASFLERNTTSSLVRGTNSLSDRTRGRLDGEFDVASWRARLVESGRCSALVRLTDGDADLVAGHATWGDYSSMIRVFKYYKFPLDGAETMADHIAMSSYPGAVSSTDSYYAMDSNMVTMDTSLPILDSGLWDRVLDFSHTPHIPTYVHILATNRLARSAAHWAQLYSSMNTGTYNAQWLVVDYNQFEAGKQLADNALWIVETVPGWVEKEDMTAALRSKGYWPSFNRPYFKKIRALAGYDEAERIHGSLYSYTDNPRSHLFADMTLGVGSLHGLRRVLRSATATGGISARMDVGVGGGPLHGGIDAKITNHCLLPQMKVQAASGPSHLTLPAFRWLNADGSELFVGAPHTGLPNEWNFNFTQMKPDGTERMTDITEC